MNNDSDPDTRHSPFGLAFDDLVAGASFESGPIEVAARDVEAFAALTGDHHPAHLDPGWAATGPFGRPIAHGLLVLSQAVGALPLDPERVIALRRLRDVVFKRPVVVGESITVSCAIGEIRPLDARAGLVDCGCRILDEEGRLSARAVIEVLWRRDLVTGDSDDLGPVTRDPDGRSTVLI